MGKDVTPVTTPLEIDDANAAIHYVELWIVSCDAPNDPSQGPVNGTILIDNLLYDRPLNPPAHESDPPIINIVSPHNNDTVTGTTPGEVATSLHAIITESALAQLTAQVNGHASRDVVYNQSAPNTYDVTISLRDVDGLVDGPNTVVLTAVDFDRPVNTTTASVTFTFKVKPIPPPSTIDILPTAIQVTQSIDPGPHIFDGNDDFGDGYIFRGPYPVALFQGKPTMIRIHAGASGTTNALANVPASIEVKKANCSSDCELAFAMPPQASKTSPNLAGITVFPFGTAGEQPWSNAGKLGSTWNFLIPPDWTNQDLVATVTVNEASSSTSRARLPFRNVPGRLCISATTTIPWWFACTLQRRPRSRSTRC